MAESVQIPAACSENQGPMLLAVSYSLLTIAIITVILRLYLRLGLRNGINSDDYTILASLVGHDATTYPSKHSLTMHQVAAIIGVGCLTKLIHEGLGRHIYCLPLEQVPQALKWSIIAQIFNVIGIGLAKISVCLCVLRIIDRTRSALATFLWVVIAFVSASHLSQVILFLIECRPMAAVWNPHIHGKCFSSHITYLAGYIGFGLDAFTDLICAGIPIFILHRLHINKRTKLALCCLMGLGSLTAGCAIAKAITLKGVFAFDYTWDLTKPAICTIIEHLTSITLVSLPALKPLFNKLLDVSRLNSSKLSSRPYFRATPAETNESCIADKSVKSEDTERAEIPLCDTILKTTDFRLSSHNSEISRRLEDYWPLPPDFVHTAGTDRIEKPSGSFTRL